MYYYGDRSCNCHPSEDIGIKYFSTSTLKLFIQDQKNNPQDYKYKIIKVFETCREDAKQLEVDLHKKFDVKKHDKFINRANQTASGFDRTGCSSWLKNKRMPQDVVDRVVATKSIIGIDGLTIYQRAFKNPIYNDGVVKKIRNKKTTTFINDKNMDIISAERAATTMNKEIIIGGNATTIYKESAKKHSTTLQNKITFEGREITLSEKYGIERSRERTQQGKKYKLLNIFDDSFEEILFANELRKISHNLQTKSKENYLGQSKFGVSRLKAQNKESLIGLYTELI